MTNHNKKNTKQHWLRFKTWILKGGNRSSSIWRLRSRTGFTWYRGLEGKRCKVAVKLMERCYIQGNAPYGMNHSWIKSLSHSDNTFPFNVCFCSINEGKDEGDCCSADALSAAERSTWTNPSLTGSEWSVR